MSALPAPEPDETAAPTVLRARGTDELIAVVPALLGFHPTRSLVAIAVHGDRGRLGLRIRIDLPPVEQADQVVDGVVRHLAGQRPDGVLLVAFAETATEADACVLAALERIEAAGLDVVDAVRCDGSRYWSYVCPDPRCCPPGGTPYDAQGNVLLAEAVFSGLEVLPDRDALARRYDPVAGPVAEQMHAATTRALVEVAAVPPDVDGDRWRRSAAFLQPGLDRVRQIISSVDQLGHWPLADDEVAVLSVWASVVVVRDVLWSGIERRNATARLELWRHVAQRVVPPFEPAVLSLAGFAAWLSGHGAESRCALDRALSADPTYSMAHLLMSALDGGLPPGVWEGLPVGDVLGTVSGLT
ncbi:MAG: DUF4192 domain-containing protein [Mycobacteriales bacterium]